MRASRLWTAVTGEEEVQRLWEKYKLAGSVGDQDWLSLVSWEHPQLVHILPCQWNKGTSRNVDCAECMRSNHSQSVSGMNNQPIFQHKQIYLTEVQEEHRPGECHEDSKEEWEVTHRQYHHCPHSIKIRHRAGSI